ncbi:hypothetical protein BV22DRAFT_1117670 [Leucogyrophana mollusca]|uniref:Uncharacterized protein n=1 Tax=Leucogyrophana mollusca TaxID=85980 RepID=A0ACB8BQN7_9AGAM|nr:hypothetical protein BV22DRAFT_1117670 [Leucogyrophana mollusca]
MSNQTRGIVLDQLWTEPRYSMPQSQLQLEEEYPYRLGSQGTNQDSHQQPPRSSYNGPYPSTQYNAFSSNQFGTSPSGPTFRGSATQQSMRGPSYETHPGSSDSGRPIDSTTNTFHTTTQRPPLQPAFMHPGYSAPQQPQTNYPPSFSAGGGSNLTPDDASASLGLPKLNNGSQTSPFASSSPMQFTYPQPPPVRNSEIRAQYMQQLRDLVPQSNPLQPQSQKRPRHYEGDEQFEPSGDMADALQGQGGDAGGRPRGTGACARCKSLKVKCEFRGESDTCRRCISAGQECVIPGRKPRRTPPKRETLMKQIREQAAQIQELMAQLEGATSNRSISTPGASASSASRLASQSLSPTSPGPQSPENDPNASSADKVTPRPEVQDWIAKARDSINAFDGLMAAGGPVTQRMHIRGETDESDSSGDEYAITFEGDSDDEEDFGYATADDDNRSHQSGSRERASISSQNTSKKKDSGVKLATMPTQASPFGLMAHLSLKSTRQKSVEPEHEDAFGVARDDFFEPSQSPDTPGGKLVPTGHQLPHILTRELVTVQEAEMLFKYYFDNINISTSLLDPDLHTAQYVVMRSPFLFTVVCAISSRYYTERPELYGEVIRYAQLAAGTAMIGGPKNEEMIAAYILLALYPVPARKWEEDRTWIYLGLAIRFAQDLGLNRPTTTTPLNEHHARVLLSRTRIWLNCFNLDRSTGSQFGQRPILPNTDYISTHCEDWWKTSEYNLDAFDIHLCVYNAELRLMADFMAKIYSDPNHPTGLNKAADLEQIASETDDKIAHIGQTWFPRLKKHTTYRNGLLKMALNYARLVALSSGLQHGSGKSEQGENSFLMRCYRAASDVVTAVLDEVFATAESRNVLRHAPDAQYIFITFASAFLVKVSADPVPECSIHSKRFPQLLKPKYAYYFPFEQRLEIRTLVQRVVDLLASPDVVVDERHAPGLYSRFLTGLLATPMAQVNAISPGSIKSPLSLPRKQSSRKDKGKRQLDKEMASPSDYPSPSSDYSQSQSQPQSPSPSQSYPLQPLLLDTGVPGSANNSTDFFHVPTTIDSELLESMQFMTDPTWQEATIPGFQWMSQMQSNRNDYNMFENPLQYSTSGSMNY